MDSVILDRIMEDNKLDRGGLDRIKEQYVLILKSILDQDSGKESAARSEGAFGVHRRQRKCLQRIADEQSQAGSRNEA